MGPGRARAGLPGAARPVPSPPAPLAELPPLFRAPAGESNPLSENYLGDPLSSADGYAFAAGAILDWLCPTLVLNAGYDHLRASGEAFTAAAALAGVDVRQVTIHGTLHGFLNLPAEVEPVRHCLDLISETVIRGGL
jgi:acetyl esterase